MRSSAAATLSLLCLCAGAARAQPAPVGGQYEFSVNWTSVHEQRWLNNLGPLKGKPGAQGLEVGCFEGRSTIWFLEKVLTHPTSRMTCIDVFTGPIEKRFDNNIEVSGLGDRLLKLKGYSQEVLRTLPLEAYDFIYIDGCHTMACALTDAVMSWYLLKPGGILIFDDYDWHMEDPPAKRPKLALDIFMEAFLDQIVVRPLRQQLIVKKKESAGRTRENLVGNPLVHTEEWERRKEAARKRRRQQGK